ncbi:exopolyphosphatase [Rubritalea spongiae]|uniref:Exopolyphosphatase n=1 Tax=Rubritalea spongiae TaxID=430797 RepID=A0ABW5E171_9BACT
MTTALQQTREIAAIDLGSNSFHMVVAKVIGPELQLVSRHKQRVSLASGLDHNNHLDEAAMQRGLDCLAMFAERLTGIAPEDVAIAATHTLRVATNATTFLQRAKKILPFPIEIIPGPEEARLVYLGVAHTQPESDSKLVVDIGGGSTELIVGRGFEPHLVNSKPMGCANFTHAYFSDGKISKKNFSKAVLAAEQKLESLASQYRKTKWDIAFGSSGTIKSISEVLSKLDSSESSFTLDGLQLLADKLFKFKTIDNIDLDGLSPERKPVFAAGIAILTAVFNAFKIEKMYFSEGALREGLLYQMEDVFHRTDIRLRTAEALALKYNVDFEHATKVKQQAHTFFDQLSHQLKLHKQKELKELLEWSALLHEVGLSINLQAVHRHSAYILRHTNLAGFNTEQQQVMATLVRFHRKSLKLHEIEDLTLFRKKHVLNLIRILRLAIVVNGQRSDDTLPPLQLSIDQDTWRLSSTDPNWLENNKLLNADLSSEQAYWDDADWLLEFE